MTTMWRWCWCWWLVQAGALPGAELLRNANFEMPGRGGLAQHWEGVTVGSNAVSTFALTREGPDGASAQRIVVTRVRAFDSAGIGQAVPELDAGLYAFRARVKSDTTLLAAVQLRGGTEPFPGFGRRRTLLAPGQWTELAGFARLPAPTREVLFLIQLHHPGELLVAEASLQAIRESELTPEERRQVERQLGPSLPPVDEARVLAETDARIRRVRTAPLTVQVYDRLGRPAPGQSVHLEHVAHWFRFGAACDARLRPQRDDSTLDRRHRALFRRLFNSATVGLYWRDYEPQPGAPRDWLPLRQIRWLERHGLAARGHPVFWNADGNLPAWLRELDPPPPALEPLAAARLAQLSRVVLPRLSDADVFNELVNWEIFTNGLTRWLAGRGKIEAVAEVLRDFKRRNPECGIVINDYDLSSEYCEVLRALLEAGAPIDLIGLQAHMHHGNWSATQTWTALERLSRLQRPILFTEVSVLSGPFRPLRGGAFIPDWKTDPEGEARQAGFLEQFYRLLYSHPACAGVILWSYSDRGAWLGAPVGIVRADGTPKPSFARLDDLINRQWRTRGQFVTGADGRVTIPNAFEGRYVVRCGGRVAEADHRVTAPATVVMRNPQAGGAAPGGGRGAN